MNYGGFSKSTVFQCARSLLLLLFSCGTRGLCNSRKPQSTFSDASTQLNISSPHIGFYQSGPTLILSLGNVHNSYIHRVIDTLPVIRLVWLGLGRIWTDSTVCQESAWDLEEFGPSRKILRTVNISRPTVIPTGRNAQHNSLHTLL